MKGKLKHENIGRSGDGKLNGAWPWIVVPTDIGPRPVIRFKL